MRTNENKKEKNQPDNGAGSTSGRGMIVFILPSMPAHSHASISHASRQHFPSCRPCRVLPARRIHTERRRCQRFQRCRRVLAAALRWPPSQAAPATQGCSHVHMCPTGVVIVGGLADSSAMGSCVHCIQSGVYESEA